LVLTVACVCFSGEWSDKGDKIERDLKTLLGKRELNAAVPALEKYGVTGLKTLEMLEDADIDEMMEKHKLPKMTGRLLKKELPSLVPVLVQNRKEKEEERNRKEEEEERNRKEKEEERKRKKLVENLQVERKIAATVIKMLPTDASDELKEVIGDILHNEESQELYLDDNNISDEGAKALAEALKVNTALQGLILDRNNISDEGAEALAEALKVNTALQHLWLENNNISDEGAEALAEALKVNTALQGLYLDENEISDAVKQQIKSDRLKF
jgi:Leucine-rich repeat (LRR) protein